MSKHTKLAERGEKFEYHSICQIISRQLETSADKNLTMNAIMKRIREFSSKYNLSFIPKNSDIIRYLPEDSKIRKLMLVRPIKTASGVLVIAIMAKPYPCPHGKCIYCPGGVEYDVPLSYTGKEPVTILAQKSEYDPQKQICSKLSQAYSRGHDISKVELVIVGGTFPFMPREYQTNFTKSCLDALNGIKSKTLEEAKQLNETSKIRCVGYTIETKPDYCKRDHIDLMLELGVTRIEIGIQTLREDLLKKVNRGHNLNDVYECFRLSRDSGFKIVAHMMPGLPGSNLKNDFEDLRKLFSDENLRPDMLKIYPTVVLENTGLAKLYENNLYLPYSESELVDLLVQVKKIVPPWVRIMRIQREINSDLIVGGPKVSNLRQLLKRKLYDLGIICQCIRCREAGLKTECQEIEPELRRIDYKSSNGLETFLSVEDLRKQLLFGFLRLRKLYNPHRKELQDNGKSCAVVRELHVYGQMIDVGKKDFKAYQHKGIGSQLLKTAERIVENEYGLSKISIISSIGTREYYRKFDYHLEGPYMSKRL
jgi:elongator complex protein 3